MKLTSKQKLILAATISIWGLVFVISGAIMNTLVKTKISTKFEVNIKETPLTEAQAKEDEILLKDFVIEVNSPISVDVKDYLKNPTTIKDDVIKKLKLDTALVNVTAPGNYQYTVAYKKKKYIGNITVKEKELPNVQFTLKEIRIKKGEVLSANKRDFINEEISDEVYNNMTLNINPDYSNNPGEYTYTIVYKDVTYKGKIIVEDIKEVEITSISIDEPDSNKTDVVEPTHNIEEKGPNQ